jgi:hypothetical protein
MENKPEYREHTFQSLALGKVGVMALCEDASLVTSHNSLKKASVNLNHDSKTIGTKEAGLAAIR